MSALQPQISWGLDEGLGEWKELETLGKVSRKRGCDLRTSQ